MDASNLLKQELIQTYISSYEPAISSAINQGAVEFTELQSYFEENQSISLPYQRHYNIYVFRNKDCLWDILWSRKTHHAQRLSRKIEHQKNLHLARLKSTLHGHSDGLAEDLYEVFSQTEGHIQDTHLGN